MYMGTLHQNFQINWTTSTLINGIKLHSIQSTGNIGSHWTSICTSYTIYIPIYNVITTSSTTTNRTIYASRKAAG